MRIHNDDERASVQIRCFERGVEWCILLGWLAAFALCMSAWYWSLKHLTLMILS
jgi:hypothetical protein